MANPWDEWIPGVLNKRQMGELLDGGFITSSGSRPKLDHSSINLSLADEAYIMSKGSVKPSDPPYDRFVSKKIKRAQKISATDSVYKLEKQHTYVFKLQEKLEAPLREAGLIYGQATAKSTVGRVDVLARLIVDGMTTYEFFDPEGLQKRVG